MVWMLLVLLYALLKGTREIAKKKAMAKNSVMEVLVIYTLLSFVFVIPQAPMASGVEPHFFIFIAIKSFCIFLAWICSFRSLKKLPVSLYGILDLSRVIFATCFGVFLLHETLAINQVFGLIIVCSGLLLLKFKPNFLKKIFKIEESTTIIQNNPLHPEENTLPTYVYIILAFASCFLNAISGFLDKVLMQVCNWRQSTFYCQWNARQPNYCNDINQTKWLSCYNYWRKIYLQRKEHSLQILLCRCNYFWYCTWCYK